MRALDRIITVVDKINEIDFLIAVGAAMVVALPFAIIILPFKGLYDLLKPKKGQSLKEEESERDVIHRRIKDGEIRMRDLPHEQNSQNRIFNFENAEHPRYARNILLYVAVEEDDVIRNFFRKEKEWIESWTWKYGFQIVQVENQDELFDQMCFPQDSVFLKHGFLRDENIWTRDREYGLNVMQYMYYPLVNGTSDTLKEQLEDIALDIYDESMM